MDSRLLVSAKEAAYRLGGISLRHLWALTAPRGRIPCVRLGKRVLYRPCDLEAFLEAAARQLAERLAGGGGNQAAPTIQPTAEAVSPRGDNAMPPSC